MSFLTLVREEAIVANVEAAKSTWEYITHNIHALAKGGLGGAYISVMGFEEVDIDHCLLALNIQGFHARWQDEGHRNIWVSWTPKHPR